MASAVSQGLVNESTVTTAASRGLMQRFVQGDFDPVATPPPPPPPPGACNMKMVAHMDTTGSYLPGTPHLLRGADATPEKCQQMCCNEPDCDTFTFDTGQSAGAADCWLKAGGKLTVGGCGVGSKYNCIHSAQRYCKFIYQLSHCAILRSSGIPVRLTLTTLAIYINGLRGAGTSGQVRTGHHAGPPSGPPGVLSWSTIDKSVVNSTAHQVRSPKLTVAFSQSSYTCMTYRVVGTSSTGSSRPT